MFNEFYGLTLDPFRLSPDPRFCYRHRNFARAKAYMQYALHQGEGFVMVTGQPGTGKTTLIEDLLVDPSTANVRIARMSSTQVAAEDLLRLVADAFDIEARTATKASMLLSLQAVLTRQMESGRNSLLIVDEAQNLPFESIEELRMITNLQIGARPLMQVFLVGQDALHAIVSQPRMEQLQQRILAACRMEPLGLEDTREYLHHRLRCAGWAGRPSLTGEAVWQIQEASRGIPRRINLLASRLLLHGCIEERLTLDGADVRLVTDELQGELLITPRPAGASQQPPAALPGQDVRHLSIELALPPAVPRIVPPETVTGPRPKGRFAEPDLTRTQTSETQSMEPAAEAGASASTAQPGVTTGEVAKSAPPRPLADEGPIVERGWSDGVPTWQDTEEDLATPAPPPPTQARDGDHPGSDALALPGLMTATAPTPLPGQAGSGSDQSVAPLDRGQTGTDVPVGPPFRPAQPKADPHAGERAAGLGPAQVSPAAPPRRGRFWRGMATTAVLIVALILLVPPEWKGRAAQALGPLTQPIAALGAKVLEILREGGSSLGLAPPLPAPPVSTRESYTGSIDTGESAFAPDIPVDIRGQGSAPKPPSPGYPDQAPGRAPTPGRAGVRTGEEYDSSPSLPPTPPVVDSLDAQGTLTPTEGAELPIAPQTSVAEALPEASERQPGEPLQASQDESSIPPVTPATSAARPTPGLGAALGPDESSTDVASEGQGAESQAADVAEGMASDEAIAPTPMTGAEGSGEVQGAEAEAEPQERPAALTHELAPGDRQGGTADSDPASLEARLVGLGFRAERIEGGSIKLTLGRDVMFNAGSTDLSPEARRSVERLAKGLADQSAIELLVVGHTDDSGPAEYNAELSLLRAKAVAAVLAAGVLPAKRIVSEGRGEDEPLTGQAIDGVPAYLINRRIEVFIRVPGQP